MNTVAAEQLIREALHRVAPDADVAHVRPDDDLRDALGLDSLDFLALVEQLSEQTRVRIEEEDYDHFATLASAAKWLGQSAS